MQLRRHYHRRLTTATATTDDADNRNDEINEDNGEADAENDISNEDADINISDRKLGGSILDQFKIGRVWSQQK